MSGCDVRITWPTTNGTLRRPASVRVHRTDYHHEMLVIDYYAEPHALQRYKEGTPIRVLWGTPPKSVTEFFGTVLFVRPNLENSRHSLQVVCVGTTYPFKDITPKVHVNHSVEQVVSQMAVAARLDLVRGPITHTWPMLARTVRETGWEYLVRLAHRQGYTLFGLQTMLHFYDPVDMLLAHKESWPVLTYHYGRGNDFSGDIIRFTPQIGDQGVPGHEGNRHFRLLTLDPVTNQIIGADDSGGITSLAAAKASPKFAGFVGQPARSVAEAKAYARGRRKDQRWVHSAVAHVYGDVRLRCGMGVYISNVSKESDGLWYVRSAVHDISAEGHPQQYRYFTELHLLRDSHEVQAVDQPSRRTLRNSSTYPTTPVLSDGRWVSQHQVERVFAA